MRSVMLEIHTIPYHTIHTIGMWFKKVEEINKMEDLILTARHQHEQNTKTWAIWNVLVFSDEGRALFERDSPD